MILYTMNRETLENTARMIAGILTEDELITLVKYLKERIHGKTETKSAAVKETERHEQKPKSENRSGNNDAVL